jgi:siroheme synthase
LALAAAGIDFEVVPGVSSAIAAAEAAQIPVTHRGVSTAFAVFAGQEADDTKGERIPWKAAANIPTAVFLMGVERLPLIVSRLIEEGRDSDTPIAIVSNATLSNQKVVTGTLESILGLAVGIEPPAVIVVGEVVRIREQIDALVRANVGMSTVAA